ncbi:MAG: hypothetical protein IJ582_05885 [Prevotella sp.]|nr:hypothetical protein [Prevotella sp.]
MVLDNGLFLFVAKLRKKTTDALLFTLNNVNPSTAFYIGAIFNGEVKNQWKRVDNVKVLKKRTRKVLIGSLFHSGSSRSVEA